MVAGLEKFKRVGGGVGGVLMRREFPTVIVLDADRDQSGA